VARELYSERSGTVRELSTDNYMLLIWGGVIKMRYDGFFDEAVGPRLISGATGPGPL
jgi:hypothetical protein